jgi:hypothetical protein
VADENASCEAVCRRHADRVRRLFDALNLEHDGLEAVRAAVGKEDWPAACEALIAYHRAGDTAKWLRVRTPKPSKRRVAVADRILKDTFTIQHVTARQPRLRNGRLNWAHNGPHSDREWGWLLNRHSCLLQLLGAWRRTGNPMYARHFDRLIRDWVVSNPVPDGGVHTAQWRVLEVGLRLRHSWPAVFHGFQQSDEFTDAGRILMLGSVAEHAEYCRRFHARDSNHLLMEMYGLANAAACWPEFKRAPRWFDYAMREMVPAMKQQVYPDGALKELTSHYHMVGIVNFEPFADLARRAGRKLPAEYAESVERMWNYTAMTIRPDGFGLLNNDSDRDDNSDHVLRAAKRYKRPDWAFVASNGEQGRKPAGPPSVVFPWAGHVVMRSGWEADAHWAFFDVGPAGTHHAHADRLHLSVAAFGRDLLVDGGRYWYKGGRWREHFLTTHSHNALLIDGCGQQLGPRVAHRTTAGNIAVTPEFDYARGTFDAGYDGLDGSATHRRVVVYLRGQCWLVFDYVASDRPRTIEALWHFHPDCTVERAGLAVASTDAKKGNLRIIPVGGPGWKLKLVEGRAKPAIQGWYSPEYNVKHPCPTAVYKAKTPGDATCTWILVPAKGVVPDVEVTSLDAPAGCARLRVTPDGGKPVEVAVRLAGKAHVTLSGGLILNGDCALLGLGDAPRVLGGQITDADGKVCARHEYPDE